MFNILKPNEECVNILRFVFIFILVRFFNLVVMKLVNIILFVVRLFYYKNVLS